MQACILARDVSKCHFCDNTPVIKQKQEMERTTGLLRNYTSDSRAMQRLLRYRWAYMPA